MSLLVYVTYEPDGSPSISGKAERRLNLMVSRLQTGADLSQEVYEKAKGDLKYFPKDYTLFWPERRLWILPEKPLGLLHLDPGAKLEYRPRRRHIRLRFLDASSKLLISDETKPVKQLVMDLCEQLRIEHPEELSLVVAGDYAIQKHHPAKSKSLTRVGPSGSPLDSRKLTLGRKEKSITGLSPKSVGDNPPRPVSPSIRRKRPGSAKKYPNWSSSKVKKQISKKHQIRLDTPWLDPNKTLAEQEVTENDELILMYRFYYHMELQRNSVNVEMLYKQARATYLAGELICSLDDMVNLSAILCQIMKGDYSKNKYNPDSLSTIKTLIAPPKCKIKAIAKQIMSQHSLLEGMAVADAKCCFIKFWSLLELFGMEFLSCTNTDTKDKGLIGISKDKIMFLHHKNKKNIFWDIDKLVQWSHDAGKDSVSLTFSQEAVTDVLNINLPEYSGVLMDCLQGHREISDTVPDIQRACNEYQFDDEMESTDGVFATLTKKRSKARRAINTLTYDDVFWASKIENPLLSEEELSQLKQDSWENPAFANMDQLMDERFNFLDFKEYSNESKTLDITSTSSTSPQSSPSHSPYLHTRPHHHTPSSSPLTIHQKMDTSPQQRTRAPPPRDKGTTEGKSRLSPRAMLHNEIMDTLFKDSGHSRHKSSESGSGSSIEGQSDSSANGQEIIGVGGESERKNSNAGLSELTVR